MAGLGSEGGGTVYLTAYSEGLLRAGMDHKPDLAPARMGASGVISRKGAEAAASAHMNASRDIARVRRQWHPPGRGMISRRLEQG